MNAGQFNDAQELRYAVVNILYAAIRLKNGAPWQVNPVVETEQIAEVDSIIAAARKSLENRIIK